MDNSDLQLIINAIKSRKCLTFIGAGASTAFRNQHDQEIPGLPTGCQLAEWLARECNYVNGSSYDLLKVTEYFVYANSWDRSNLEKALRDKIQSCDQPRPIHTVLAQLPQIRFIITTNYDTLLERELKRYKRLIIKHVYDRSDSKTAHFQVPFEREDRDVILHKMHGCVEMPESMVITESDYIQYLANLNDADRGMPEVFRKNIIPQYILLFLGYGLADWNFRVIWQGVLAQLANKHLRKDSYALVRAPAKQLVRYWQKQDVVVLDQDLTEFATQLAQHFNLEIPQLGIAKQPRDS
ncbi:MAG: SIR2 family protein, partial [Methylococcales bacterium]